MSRAGRVGKVVALAAVASLAVGIAGWLGWWQWTRAQDLGLVVEPAVAPIAEVLAPATEGGSAIGRTVSVPGAWGEGTVLIPGREVDGEPAVLLVREFTVSAAATGTGGEATLLVLVGWAPPEPLSPPADLGGREVELVGYLRAGEAPSGPGVAPPDLGVAGADVALAMSPAERAAAWPSPLYSLVLVADDSVEGYAPMPAPNPEVEWRLQNLAYAFEWWIFGAFAAVIAVRLMRDNGTQEED